MTATTSAPSLDVDPYAQDNLLDPYPLYRTLREAGPVVWLPRYEVHAFGRDADVRAILEDWETFISGAGVGPRNLHHEPPLRRPGILEVDPPIHTRMRRAMAAVINPRNLRGRRADFQEYADEIVTELLARRSFDAATDLAQPYILRVFGDAVGIPRAGRAENLIAQGAMNFSTFGPINETAEQHIAAAQGTLEWVMENCDRSRLAPGGMGEQIWQQAEAGVVPPEEATLLVRALLSAGLDTTIAALINTLLLLAKNPEAYARVHADPRLMKFAIDEAFRLESPFQLFYRTTSRPVTIGDVDLPEDTKVLVILGSANRDERRWGEDADRFDLDRDTSGHLTFGMGIHQCIGQPISRMEMDVLLTTFARRVSALELAGPVAPFIHTTIRTWDSVPVTVTPA